MAFINVAEWSPENVADWLKGLDDSILPYVSFFLNNGVNGCRLLLLSSDDLDNLNVHKIGHQELILEGVDLLKHLHYNFASETLQSQALRLGCKARSLYNQLRHDELNDGLQQSKDAERVKTATLSGVSDILISVKSFISWIDRYPFCNQTEEYLPIRKTILDHSIELASTAQRDQFVDKPNLVIKTSVQRLADLCDRIVQNNHDPLSIQPALLEVVAIKKRKDDDLGLHIFSSYSGIHIVGGIKSNSPSHKFGRIEEGDEIVQINYQTVVGWTLKKLVATMKEHPTEIILTMKKRPRHSPYAGQIIIVKPYKVPRPKSHSRQAGDHRLRNAATAPMNTLESDEDEQSFDRPYKAQVNKGPVYQPQPRRPKLRRRATITGASPTTPNAPIRLDDMLVSSTTKAKKDQLSRSTSHDVAGSAAPPAAAATINTTVSANLNGNCSNNASCVTSSAATRSGSSLCLSPAAATADNQNQSPLPPPLPQEPPPPQVPSHRDRSIVAPSPKPLQPVPISNNHILSSNSTGNSNCLGNNSNSSTPQVQPPSLPYAKVQPIQNEQPRKWPPPPSTPYHHLHHQQDQIYDHSPFNNGETIPKALMCTLKSTLNYGHIYETVDQENLLHHDYTELKSDSPVPPPQPIASKNSITALATPATAAKNNTPPAVPDRSTKPALPAKPASYGTTGNSGGIVGVVIPSHSSTPASSNCGTLTRNTPTPRPRASKVKADFGPSPPSSTSTAASSASEGQKTPPPILPKVVGDIKKTVPATVPSPSAQLINASINTLSALECPSTPDNIFSPAFEHVVPKEHGARLAMAPDEAIFSRDEDEDTETDGLAAPVTNESGYLSILDREYNRLFGGLDAALAAQEEQLSNPLSSATGGDSVPPPLLSAKPRVAMTRSSESDATNSDGQNQQHRSVSSNHLHRTQSPIHSDNSLSSSSGISSSLSSYYSAYLELPPRAQRQAPQAMTTVAQLHHQPISTERKLPPKPAHMLRTGSHSRQPSDPCLLLNSSDPTGSSTTPGSPAGKLPKSNSFRLFSLHSPKLLKKFPKYHKERRLEKTSSCSSMGLRTPDSDSKKSGGFFGSSPKLARTLFGLGSRKDSTGELARQQQGEANACDGRRLMVEEIIAGRQLGSGRLPGRSSSGSNLLLHRSSSDLSESSFDNTPYSMGQQRRMRQGSFTSGMATATGMGAADSSSTVGPESPRRPKPSAGLGVNVFSKKKRASTNVSSDTASIMQALQFNASPAVATLPRRAPSPDTDEWNTIVANLEKVGLDHLDFGCTTRNAYNSTTGTTTRSPQDMQLDKEDLCRLVLSLRSLQRTLKEDKRQEYDAIEELLHEPISLEKLSVWIKKYPHILA